MSDLTPKEIKESLPLAFVLEAMGVPTNGETTLLCPFHDEDTPSFTIYEGDNGVERYGCFGCAKGGDVISLIREFNSDLDFEGAKDLAETLIERMQGEEWAKPPIKAKVQLSPADVQERIAAAQRDVDLELVQSFIDARAWPFTAEWLVENFGIGTLFGRIFIPLCNWSGEIYSYKSWGSPESKREIAAGTRFSSDSFYQPITQIWDITKPVIVCEGESDVWNAFFKVGDRFNVLGVLTGAGTKPSGLDRFADIPTYLAFDGDESGIRAARAWSEELAKVTDTVLLIPIGRGCDVSTTPDLEGAIKDAKTPTRYPGGIKTQPNGYVRTGDDGGGSYISNWTFDVSNELVHGDSIIYEGRINPGNQPATINSSDLKGRGKIIDWCTKYRRSWYGSDRDAQLILGMIQADAAYLPSGISTDVAGLHGQTFVWPTGQIGQQQITYIPPTIDVHLESRIKIKKGELDTSIIHHLYNVQVPGVTGPILAWLAAAPLRSLFPFFPILNVTGLAGSGKTTTTELMVQLFSGSEIQATFTVSSPHAMSGIIASTNADPVHLDEYRKGARTDTLEAARQLFRDAYTMQESQKGGMSTNVMALGSVIPSAPIVVTGEDSFEEASHADRMIFVRVRKEGHQFDVFRRLQKQNSFFAWNFRQWLVLQNMGRYINQINLDSGPADLSSRQRQNLGVLELGWRILNDFLTVSGTTSLGELDTREAVQEFRTINNAHPLDSAIADAIRLAHTTATGVSVERDTYIIVPSVLMNWVIRNTQHKMHSGILGLERDIMDRYKGEHIANAPGTNLPAIKVQAINFKVKVQS